MGELLKKAITGNKGEVAAGFLLRVFESLLIAGILGIITVYGYTQTVKVEIDGIKCSIARVEGKVDIAATKLANVAEDLAVHKASSPAPVANSSLSIDAIKAILQEFRRDLKKGEDFRARNR